MQRVQQASQRLADTTAAQIEALWTLHEAGDLPLPEFRSRAAALVATANAAGVMIADIGISAEVTRQLGTPTPPLGLVPNEVQVDQDRMVRDLDRIIARTDNPSPELTQWARSEPLLTVATSVQVAMQDRDAQGWTRQLSGGSCPLCNRWADGVVRPTSVRMARHPGCDCIQQPQF